MTVRKLYRELLDVAMTVTWPAEIHASAEEQTSLQRAIQKGVEHAYAQLGCQQDTPVEDLDRRDLAGFHRRVLTNVANEVHGVKCPAELADCRRPIHDATMALSRILEPHTSFLNQSGPPRTDPVPETVAA